ncbi:hypothetical protein [Lacihabitans soyangensis]|uniref:Uncharacterized protein n=1 Tax=Lacihabitans soyangensis TaxID=869394 RepID=A0AAE3H2K2_9BACT|nr:hypothetical protein [Lacihabitans soyangensis]MCP9763909.1 hypothetical protein [Lacihabitans soyangensis]
MKNKEMEELDLVFDQGAHIVEFLKSRPFISVNQVEIAAGMPKSSLAAAMIGKRNIPVKYWYTLNNILSAYGYSINDAVECDPPFDLELPFKNLEISVHEAGIYFSKNYAEVKDVEVFLNHVLIALEKRQENEIKEYGREFVLDSRLIGKEEI